MTLIGDELKHPPGHHHRPRWAWQADAHRPGRAGPSSSRPPLPIFLKFKGRQGVATQPALPAPRPHPQPGGRRHTWLLVAYVATLRLPR